MVAPWSSAATVANADDFANLDPIDGSITKNQGIRVYFEDSTRIVYRLSGTGTVGATLRVYVERFEDRADRLHRETQEALATAIRVEASLAEFRERTGRDTPTVIT